MSPVLINQDDLTEEIIAGNQQAEVKEVIVNAPSFELLELEIPTLTINDIVEEEIAPSIMEETSLTAVSGGYLTPPSVIYEEEDNAAVEQKEVDIHNENKTAALHFDFVREEEDLFKMQLVEKDIEPAEDFSTGQVMFMNPTEENVIQDDEEEQRKKAAERLHKLRNLSFNIYGTDANNDFDTGPAYVRRNLELYSTISPAENFYSNYTVNADENNQAHLSKLNSFLDGNKPD
jgi:cell division protein FtsZ